MTSLVIAVILGTAPAPAPAAHVVPLAAADSEAVLTTEAVTGMTTFWTRFTQEPDSIKNVGRKATQKALTLTAGQRQMPSKGVDIIAMAAKYPSVAADLKQAGLTAAQWDVYRQALLNVDVTQQVGSAGGAVPANSALEKNVAFVKAHEKEVAALKTSGMWFPKLQQGRGGGGGGGGSGDLDP